MLATSAFPALLGAMRRRVVPVYDHALMTEPLGEEHWAAVGWRGYQGLSDAGNRFHYYRARSTVASFGEATTPSTTMAAPFGPSSNGAGPPSISSPSTSLRRSRSLRGCAYARLGGRDRYLHAPLSVLGDGRMAAASPMPLATPEWVSASRVSGRWSGSTCSTVGQREPTYLTLTSTKPLPWPPEPLRAGVVRLTSWSLGRADAREGRRNLWLRTLDRCGLGFD